MSEFTTVFGSLNNYEKGSIEIIDDDPKRYTFSNVFEVANISAPYERVAVGQNLKYVIEVARAEGQSPWYACNHDEFVVVMDGEVEVRLVKLDDLAATVAPEKEGAVLVSGEPQGKKMGLIKCRRGHQALLPKGAAYQFHSDGVGVLLIQTIKGDCTVEKWAEICLK